MIAEAEAMAAEIREAAQTDYDKRIAEANAEAEKIMAHAKELDDAKQGEYDKQVYVLPKALDEKVAALHLDKVGAKLTKLNDKQSKYLGLPAQGPFKTNEYRY